MKTQVALEHWDWPIFQAEANGCDYIKLSLSEPSLRVDITATVSLEAATTLGQRLIRLSEGLKEEGK